MKNDKPLLKICGLRDAANISAVALHRPDFMGFIFYPHSPRYIGFEFVLPDLPPSIRKVGVFVDEEPGIAAYEAQSFGIDHLQLSGSESPAVCSELRSKGFSIIKVIHVDPSVDFSSTDAYEGCVDMFLFDTKSKGFGGSGSKFDWTLLQKYKGRTPFLLAGGLGPDNIREAMALKHEMLAGFDVNSGVEKAPGLKDVTRVAKVRSLLD